MDYKKKPKAGSQFSADITPQRILNGVSNLNNAVDNYDLLLKKRRFVSLNLRDRAQK